MVQETGQKEQREISKLLRAARKRKWDLNKDDDELSKLLICMSGQERGRNS